MAENKVKNSAEQRENVDSSEGKRNPIGSFFNGSGKLEKIFEDGIPVRYMPKILFVAFLLVLYIMNSYLIEKKRIRIQKVKAEIEDLRTDYTTMKADYMFKGKQSEVAKRVSSMGLKESSEPPFRIVVREVQ